MSVYEAGWGRKGGYQYLQSLPALLKRRAGDDDFAQPRSPRALQHNVKIRVVLARAAIDTLVHVVDQIGADIDEPSSLGICGR